VLHSVQVKASGVSARVSETDMAFSPPGGDRPKHPMALGAMATFQAGSRSTLIGRVDPERGGRMTDANPALAAWLSGPCPAELAGVLSPRSLEHWRRVVGRVAADGRARAVRLRFTRRPPAGGRRPAQGDYRCLASPDEGGSVWLLGEPFPADPEAGDLAARRLRASLGRARRRAVALARTDHLTGLANRRQGERWLTALTAEAARTGRPLACLMVDLDRFKAVNDTHGHPAGDLVLRAAGEALGGAVRGGDRVARHGGEEFLVLLPDTGLDGAWAVAARLRGRLAGRAVELADPAGGGGPVRVAVTASVGLAGLRPGETAGRLLARADAALARAKAAGRDRAEADP